MGASSTKTPKLTIKQAKFVKAKAEGKTGVQAAKEAYGKPGKELDYWSANAIAVQNSQKLSIQEAVRYEMEKQGITLEAIIKPITDGLQAEKVNVVGNGEQAMAEITPDHSIRLKASSMAAQFMGIGRNNEAGPSIHFHGHVGEQRTGYDI